MKGQRDNPNVTPEALKAELLRNATAVVQDICSEPLEDAARL